MEFIETYQEQGRLSVGFSKQSEKALLSMAQRNFIVKGIIFAGLLIAFLPLSQRDFLHNLPFFLYCVIFPIEGLLSIRTTAKAYREGDFYFFDQKANTISHDSQTIASFDAVLEVKAASRSSGLGQLIILIVLKSGKSLRIVDASSLTKSKGINPPIVFRYQLNDEIIMVAKQIANYIGVELNDESASLITMHPRSIS